MNTSPEPTPSPEAARLLEENLTERIAADLARLGADSLRSVPKAAV